MHSSTTAADDTRTHTFDDLPLAAFLKETVRSVGYTHPTPIQASAIPLVCEGRDLIGLAQTGTGKTAAFVLPILQRLSGRKDKGARALILAPTRELAEQINDVIKELSPRSGLKSVTIYGGVSHGRQISDLRGRPQIIVACPGRLLDHLGGKTIDLSEIEVLVLDEADRMCDMGFLPDIKKIIQKLPTERQTLLFSATMPEEIKQLTKGIQTDPAMVRVKMEDSVASVTHSMYQIQQSSKAGVLSHWLAENKNALVIVFTKMKFTAKRLAEQLERRGELVTSLHGNLSQGKRQKALQGFKDGRYRVLIATDIAARGIDVKGITHVVNYDMPENLDAYIHRTGRAGRAEATGDAISLVTRADASLVRSVERWINAPITKLPVPELDGVMADEVSMGDREERRPSRGGSPRGRGQRDRQRSRPSERRPREARGGDERAERSSGEESRPRQSRYGARDSGGDRREGQQRARGRGTGDGASRGNTRTRDDNSRGNSRGPRGDGRERTWRRSDDRGGERRSEERSNPRHERQPRLAFGVEAEALRPRSSSPSQGRQQRDRFSRDSSRGRSSERRHNGGYQRSEPRGRFEGATDGAPERDISQVEALKVLERREKHGGGNHRGGGRRRPGGGNARRGGPQGGSGRSPYRQG